MDRCAILPGILKAPQKKTFLFYVFPQNSNEEFFQLKSFLEEGKA